jgi:hypothetical protein
MSGQVKKLVRCLQASGSSTMGDGSLCLLSQDGGRLVEKIYSDDDLQNQRKVADNVKSNTSAAYVATEENVSQISY